MASDETQKKSGSEFLYHVKRTVVDYAQDKSGATQSTDILGTFTDLTAAKAAARSALASEGYLRDEFDTYEENYGTDDWKYGDGVIVFAKAPAGQEFRIRLDTKPNVYHFHGNTSGEVEDHLQYVLQTTINYNKDSTGGIQTTEIEGTYPTRKAAFDAAKVALLDDEITKASFAEYDEKDAEKDEWPYGDIVLVHAVADTGENFEVSVKVQPHSHRHHECKHHDNKKCDCSCKHTDLGCKHKSCKHEECESSNKSN